MKTRSHYLPVSAVALAGLVLFLAWPTIALIGVSISQGEAPHGGFSFSARQLGLLWRSVWLSATAAGLCILYSLPVVYALGRLLAAPTAAGAVTTALLATSLLCPPMVYAFAWEQILPSTFSASSRCIGVWALWAWPIPAVLISSGWLRIGLSIHEAAMLDASLPPTFLRVVLPALKGYIGLSALILFVVFFGEYSVPHACGLLVYATELLGWSAVSGRTIDALWPAIPPVVIIMICLLCAFWVWRRCPSDDGLRVHKRLPAQGSMKLIFLAGICFAGSWLLPITVLTLKLASLTAMREAMVTYLRDMVWSVGVAALAGVVVVALGVAAVINLRLGRLAFVWAVAFGALPGALIGESLIAAYNHPIFYWLYDYWPIMTIAYVSRFAWVGMLIAAVITIRTGSDLVAQARTDGADETGIWRNIHIPLSGPTLLCAAAVVTALAVGDLATSSLVRVPDFNPIAHVIIEKFHRREDDMLVCLSLGLIALSLPPACLAAWIWNRSAPMRVA